MNEIGVQKHNPRLKKAIDLEGVLCILIIIIIFGFLGREMGFINCINTLLNTAYALLTDTVLYIVAVAVIAGALAGILSEFGVISIANRILSPFMQPLYGLPGAAIIGVFTTYMSDNPAILSLCDNKSFLGYFKKEQVPALCNLGTAFGMGMIITVFMVALPNPNGDNFLKAAIIGNIGAIIGSIISVRLMILCTKKYFKSINESDIQEIETGYDILKFREIRKGNVAERLLNSILEGGASGVKVGFEIIPGVLIVCSVILMLTCGTSIDCVYTGAAYEGIALLPAIGEKLSFILTPLFGFSSPGNIAVPITALGASAAAISLVPEMILNGSAAAHDVAVFTAMCMCWSGYLATHISMMDGLKRRELTSSAIVCHTIGGIVAGISANLIFLLLS